MKRVTDIAAGCVIVAVIVAAEEIGYWHSHRHRAGPALWIGLLALVVAVLAALLAWWMQEQDRRNQATVDELRRQIAGR